jgi:DNA mismatch endonuclease (patch repair protein)
VVDVFTPQKRSQVMAAIRSKGNRSTEVALAHALRSAGVRGWRRHVSVSLPAEGLRTRGSVRPDFVFRRERLVVFVDGCFWHSCPLHSRPPANNRRFWAEKLAANVARDKYCNRELRRAGWAVIRLWEHDVEQAPDASAKAVGRRIRHRQRSSRLG